MRLIVVFILLVCLGCKNESDTSNHVDNSDTTAQNSEKTIDLEVYDFDGLENFLEPKGNKTYVVNFWATWCAPCVKELPYFEMLNKNFADDVEVILVSLDFPSKYESNLKPFIEKHDLKSKVVALNDTDSNTWIPKIDKNWSGAIPATLIFNKNHRIFYEQSFEYDELEQELNQFLTNQSVNDNS
ncbi:MAG: TlpA disulfide reductase family protein [Bacteroidota bacterium]